MKKILWTEERIAQLKSHAEAGKNINEICEEIGATCNSIRNTIAKHKIKVVRLRDAGRPIGNNEPTYDKYELQVLEAFNMGKTDVFDIIKHTKLRGSRIKAIAKNLGLKINKDRFDNQIGQIMHYGIGASQRRYD